MKKSLLVVGTLIFLSVQNIMGLSCVSPNPVSIKIDTVSLNNVKVKSCSIYGDIISNDCSIRNLNSDSIYFDLKNIYNRNVYMGIAKINKVIKTPSKVTEVGGIGIISGATDSIQVKFLKNWKGNFSQSEVWFVANFPISPTLDKPFLYYFNELTSINGLGYSFAGACTENDYGFMVKGGFINSPKYPGISASQEEIESKLLGSTSIGFKPKPQNSSHKNSTMSFYVNGQRENKWSLKNHVILQSFAR